ncbi:uncharacterized protein L203_100221 [Cryptococcus depauperatus CBS 7841]|uniref:Uncharacterized protein n=1 Tax=Cryptococcus depauperatus CBS 7841 TaxID=1295531 RepID=A0A1E3J1X2_9TREE|nr:hypothetical protein L203_00119 [Cryptococcus depauperatus CBS 7841]
MISHFDYQRDKDFNLSHRDLDLNGYSDFPNLDMDEFVNWGGIVNDASIASSFREPDCKDHQMADTTSTYQPQTAAQNDIHPKNIGQDFINVYLEESFPSQDPRTFPVHNSQKAIESEDVTKSTPSAFAWHGPATNYMSPQTTITQSTMGGFSQETNRPILSHDNSVAFDYVQYLWCNTLTDDLNKSSPCTQEKTSPMFLKNTKHLNIRGELSPNNYSNNMNSTNALQLMTTQIQPTVPLYVATENNLRVDNVEPVIQQPLTGFQFACDSFTWPNYADAIPRAHQMPLQTKTYPQMRLQTQTYIQPQVQGHVRDQGLRQVPFAPSTISQEELLQLAQLSKIGSASSRPLIPQTHKACKNTRSSGIASLSQRASSVCLSESSCSPSTIGPSSPSSATSLEHGPSFDESSKRRKGNEHGIAEPPKTKKPRIRPWAPRIWHSCQACRSSKRKCRNGDWDTKKACDGCIFKGIPCLWSAEKRVHGPSKSKREAKEAAKGGFQSQGLAA